MLHYHHSNKHHNLSQQMPQAQESEHKTFLERDVVVVSFSLDKEILDAINEQVGNHKGKRSEWARRVFRKALNI